MDVTLVLTHRCNLACHYCYAGRHLLKDVDEKTLSAATGLLYADGAKSAQLSFFGGEPFLAYRAMRRAITLARFEAQAHQADLVLQCTTNGTVLDDEHVAFIKESGMHVTVSIDGIREAHELNRPKLGGQSSFDTTHRGLRRLLDAGVEAEAMMVITPQTVSMAFASVEWLWQEGVKVVHANPALNTDWSDSDRQRLRRELTDIARAQLAHRLFGRHVCFEPFDAGLKPTLRAASGPEGPGPHPLAGQGPYREAAPAPKNQVVVATSGNLYPCAPMVGEDNDEGPEAALRLGHLDEGVAALMQRLQNGGVHCEGEEGCACAAYLETGNRRIGGPIGHTFGELCQQLGAMIGTSLLSAPPEDGPTEVVAEPKKKTRRAVLAGLALAAGTGIGATLWLQSRSGFGGRTAGVPKRPPKPPGQMAAPPAPPRPPSRRQRGGVHEHVQTTGVIARPAPRRRIEVDGDMAAPPKPPKEKPRPAIRGQLRRKR